MKMKKYSLLLISALSVSSIFAQSMGSTISLTVGSATALGDFGSQDADASNAGGAGSGLTFDLAAKVDGTPKYKNFGFNILLKLQVNPIGQDFADDFVAGFPAGTTASFGAYMLTGYMIGTHYNWKLSDKFAVQPKVLIGSMDAKSPQFDVSFLGNKFAEIAAGEASTFTTLLGADLVYDIGKIRLQAGYDFVIANPKYDVKFIDVSSGTTDSYVWDQSLRTYNFSVGLGYHF